MVASVMGYGKWEAYGAGRVVVGVGDGYSAGETGGEKMHTLTVDEMPSHTHQSDTMYPISDTEATGGHSTTWSNKHGSNNMLAVGNTGGGQAHNNMQPYVVAYKWRRIA